MSPKGVGVLGRRSNSSPPHHYTISAGLIHRVHIFTRDETGLVCLLTQLERTLQLYW
jgi:hypothetical protein